jgi:hypothetical protein
VEDDALELVELGRGVARARVILQGKVRLSVPGPARLGPRPGGGSFAFAGAM